MGWFSLIVLAIVCIFFYLVTTGRFSNPPQARKIPRIVNGMLKDIADYIYGEEQRDLDRDPPEIEKKGDNQLDNKK